MALKIRQIQDHLIDLHARPRGRLLVVTGARQVGKTTLARAAFPDHALVNLDSPVERAVYERLTPADWVARFPRAIIDEAQKLPAIFDTIKACHDRAPEVRYVLLGSSRVLLMKNVSETLAGRAALAELFPFTLPELVAADGAPPGPSRFSRLLEAADPGAAAGALFRPTLPLEDGTARARAAWSRFLEQGAMPPIAASDWSGEDCREWLRDYQSTYLQRDLADLARLDRLEPFARAQRAAALRVGQPVNFADLARLAGIPSATASQFVRYLEISYQVFQVPAWSRNTGKRLTRRPKLAFLDPGLQRVIAGAQGDPSGPQLEGAVAAEAIKQIRTARLPVEAFHLRTADGREVDLLLEREDGYVALECKSAERAHAMDFRNMRGLEEILDKPLLLGLVVSHDPQPRPMAEAGDRRLAVPAWSLFS
jgi:hypothetical protein